MELLFDPCVTDLTLRIESFHILIEYSDEGDGIFVHSSKNSLVYGSDFEGSGIIILQDDIDFAYGGVTTKCGENVLVLLMLGILASAGILILEVIISLAFTGSANG